MSPDRTKETRMRWSALLALAMAPILGGCATRVESPRYYTLDMTPANTAICRWNLSFDQLVRAEPLLRPNLLVRKDPVEIEYYAVEHWASGVDDLVREKLETEFGPHQPEAPAMRLSGQILALEQVDADGGAEARAKLRLSFRPSGMKRHEDPLLTVLYEATEPAASPVPGDVVAALSRCLETIAADIIADANRLPLPEGKEAEQAAGNDT